MSHASPLHAPTDPRWFEHAVQHWQELLLDHANCEKKAASTALALMFAYPEDFELADRMSRLAREELRHFEGPFYDSLAAAESRHAGLYLRLAQQRAERVRERLDELAAVEADLAVTPDPEFRFHSGTP